MNRMSRALMLSPQRLLHIEASGSEVAIDYGLVRHVGRFAELSRLIENGKVMENVAIHGTDIIPVIDIRGTPEPTPPLPNDAAFNDFLVLSLQDQLVGVRVNRVIDILLAPAIDIDSSAGWRGRQADFITGMVTLKTRRLPVVDMLRLLTPAMRPATSSASLA